MTNPTLEQQLQSKREELLIARKSLHQGTLQNPHQIKKIKQEIARILTQINKKGVQ